MNKLLYIIILLGSICLFGCNKPDIGYLYTDTAAFSIDTLRIIRFSNLQKKITDLENMFDTYPANIITLLEETDSLEIDYAEKEKIRIEMYEEFEKIRQQYKNASDAEKPYYQKLMEEYEKKYIHYKDTVVWEVEKAIRNNKSTITNQCYNQNLPDPYTIRDEISQLKTQIEKAVPWTTAQLEQILGTQPLIYSLAEIKTPNGTEAANNFAEHLTILGGGRMYVDAKIDAPEGLYVISLKVENEGHSAILEDIFTFILE